MRNQSRKAFAQLRLFRCRQRADRGGQYALNGVGRTFQHMQASQRDGQTHSPLVLCVTAFLNQPSRDRFFGPLAAGRLVDGQSQRQIRDAYARLLGDFPKHPHLGAGNSAGFFNHPKMAANRADDNAKLL